MHKGYRLIDINRTWFNTLQAPPKDGLIVACMMPGGYIWKMYLSNGLWYHADSGGAYGIEPMLLKWLPDHLVEAIL